ncbi:MAG: molybdenum cofactor guanylyltransferase [Phycisphaerales bacterium]|nr:molybdenum cofactor guanylyltransferase [Phycisphaerales bacterium]
MNTKQGTAGIILCGGLGRRMGCPKSDLEIAGRTYLQRIEVVLASACAPIIVSTRPHQKLHHVPNGVIFVADRIQGVGPLGGLEAALREASSHRSVAIVIGCDYPLIEPTLLGLLLSNIGDFDAVVPEVKGRLHPLAACYKTSLADSVSGYLNTQVPRVLGFVATLRVRVLSEAELTQGGCSARSLTNVNTPSEHLAISSYQSA